MIYFALAFKEIDVKGQNSITKEDLKYYTKSTNAPKQFEEKFLQIFDQNGKGSITFNEYCNILGFDVPDKVEMNNNSNSKIANAYDKLPHNSINSELDYNKHVSTTLSSEETYTQMEDVVNYRSIHNPINGVGNSIKPSNINWITPSPRNIKGNSVPKQRLSSRDHIRATSRTLMSMKESYYRTADNRVVSKFSIPNLTNNTLTQYPVNERGYTSDVEVKKYSSKHQRRFRMYENNLAEALSRSSISKGYIHKLPRDYQHSNYLSQNVHKPHRAEKYRSFRRRSGDILHRSHSGQRIVNATLPRCGPLSYNNFGYPRSNICANCQESVGLCIQCQRPTSSLFQPQTNFSQTPIMWTPTLTRQSLFAAQQSPWNAEVATIPNNEFSIPTTLIPQGRRHCVCCPLGEHQNVVDNRDIIQRNHFSGNPTTKRTNRAPIKTLNKNYQLQNSLNLHKNKVNNIHFSQEFERSLSEVTEVHKIDNMSRNSLHQKQTLTENMWINQKEKKELDVDIKREDGFPMDYEDFFSAGDESQIETVGEFEEDKIQFTNNEKLTIIHIISQILEPGIKNFQLAKELKFQMDKTFDKEWQVVAGRGDFGSHFACVKRFFFHFKAFDWLFLIWKTH